MLNKITISGWLFLAAFAIVVAGCSTSPQHADIKENISKVRPAQYTNALELMKQGSYQKAHVIFTQLKESYPHADLFTNLSIIEINQKQYDKALENIEKSIKTNGKNAISRNLYGLVLRYKGNFSLAESEYKKSIELDPGYPDPYLNLAILYDIYLDLPQKSLPYYEKYKEISGSHANKNIDKWLIEVKRRIK